MRYASLNVLSAIIVSFFFAAGLLVGDAQALPTDGSGLVLAGGVTSTGDDAIGNDAYSPAKPGGDCIETCSIQQEYYEDEQYGDEQYEEPYDDQYDDPNNEEIEDQYGDADEQYNDDYGDPGYQEEVYPDDEYGEEYGNEEAYDDYGDPGTYDEGMQ